MSWGMGKTEHGNCGIRASGEGGKCAGRLGSMECNEMGWQSMDLDVSKVAYDV